MLQNFINDCLIETVFNRVSISAAPLKILEVEFFIKITAASVGRESLNADVTGYDSGRGDGCQRFITFVRIKSKESLFICLLSCGYIILSVWRVG